MDAVFLHNAQEAPDDSFLNRHPIRRFPSELTKYPCEGCCDLRITGNGTQSQIARPRLSGQLPADDRWVDVQNVPTPNVTQRRPIVHLSRIDHDDIARARLDFPENAPGPLRPNGQDPDSELIVRMPGKGMTGQHRHGLDAGDVRSMLEHAVRYAVHHERNP